MESGDDSVNRTSHFCSSLLGLLAKIRNNLCYLITLCKVVTLHFCFSLLNVTIMEYIITPGKGHTARETEVRLSHRSTRITKSKTSPVLISY